MERTMPRQLARVALVMVIFAQTLAMSPAPAQPNSVTVFAAASMKNALDDLSAAFTKNTGIKVVTSFAATSALMRQIEQGAPADIFVSADLDWMDYGLRNKLINPSTRINLLGNRLVLIAPKEATVRPVTLTSSLDLAKIVGNDRIVTGEVKSVPAGRYAIAALQKLGLWSSVKKRVAMVENVRVALTLVTRGEAAFGIVYETDARAEPGVKVIGQFPPDSHPAIVYPVGATVNAGPAATRYLDMLQSTTARAVFERHGFAFLIRPTS
jgi:molybdate transport system substrate-binding protein